MSTPRFRRAPAPEPITPQRSAGGKPFGPRRDEQRPPRGQQGQPGGFAPASGQGFGKPRQGNEGGFKPRHPGPQAGDAGNAGGTAGAPRSRAPRSDGAPQEGFGSGRNRPAQRAGEGWQNRAEGDRRARAPYAGHNGGEEQQGRPAREARSFARDGNAERPEWQDRRPARFERDGAAQRERDAGGARNWDRNRDREQDQRSRHRAEGRSDERTAGEDADQRGQRGEGRREGYGGWDQPRGNARDSQRENRWGDPGHARQEGQREQRGTRGGQPEWRGRREDGSAQNEGPRLRPGAGAVRQSFTPRQEGDADGARRDGGYPRRNDFRRDTEERRAQGEARRPYGETRRPYDDERRPYDAQRRAAGDTRRPFSEARRPDDDERRPYAEKRSWQERGQAGRDAAQAGAPYARGEEKREYRRDDDHAPGHSKPFARPARQAHAAQNEDGMLRLSKRMSELGLCSRREADDWIARGWVRVDGKVVSELGHKIRREQHVSIEKQAQEQQARRVTILLHKPVGFVSGQAEDGYQPAVVLVKPENRWAECSAAQQFHARQLKNLVPAGRLDIDSVGLLVLTQDGRMAKQLIGEDSTVDKEYLVRVRYEKPGRLPEADLQLLRHGLELDGQPLLPAEVEWQNDDQLRFVLREGKKRQIRRMCEAVGLKVVGLKRIRIGNILLGDLPAGQWRYLREDEAF